MNTHLATSGNFRRVPQDVPDCDKIAKIRQKDEKKTIKLRINSIMDLISLQFSDGCPAIFLLLLRP